MKRLSILILFIGFTTISFAQKSYPITISQIKVKLSGETFEMKDEITDNIVDGVSKDFVVFDNGNVKFITSIEFIRVGKRLKVKKRNRAEANGKVLNGKWEKKVHFIRTSVIGEFEEKSRGNFVLDKKNLDAIFASFLYKIKYK